MRTLRPLPFLAVLALASAPNAMSQVTYPDFVLQNGNWTNDTRHFTVTNRILSPGIPGQPLTVSTDADVEFVSATQVHLTDGFHAGSFTNNGHFRAYINSTRPDDVVAIAPDPSTHVVNNVMHVEKWEKLEIGLRLPQEYQDAIDRFFAHYYPGPDPDVSNAGNVDPQHDLNPYADDSLQVVMTLTNPSGTQTLKWGFFMREATWTPSDHGQLAPNADSPYYPYNIRFRIAPDMEGPWRFSLSIAAPNTLTNTGDPIATRVYDGYSFVCDPPLDDNKGYLRVNAANHQTLQFEDGTSFMGLGINMAGPHHVYGTFAPNPPLNNGSDFYKRDFDMMRTTMEQFHSVGGNYMRIWLSNGVFTPDWVNLGVFDRYRSEDPCSLNGIPIIGNCQYQAWAFDQMIEQARANDIYLQMCVDPDFPMGGFQRTWNNDPYVLHYVKPHEDAVTHRFDLKRFFYSYVDDNPANARYLDRGAFYYWKRRYKYMMNRWGYSVNLAVIEPFNEIDQMLTYRTTTADGNCSPNNGVWTYDPDLRSTIGHWFSDIANYIRDPVDPTHPATSPLGDHRQLFLASYTSYQTTDPAEELAHFDLFTNPQVDLKDLHVDVYEHDGIRDEFLRAEHYQQNTGYFDANGNLKPFHFGEYTTYGNYENPITHYKYESSYRIFDNYDMRFHNELWASTFYGGFATGMGWSWERVFWWPDGTPQSPLLSGFKPIPPDIGNNFQLNHSGIKNEVNQIKLTGFSDPIRVKNKTTYHNYKPLFDFLNGPNLQAFDFFNGKFSPHFVVDANAQIEAYYLLRESDDPSLDQNFAIGWVHNMNAYWRAHYYIRSADSNFLGCTDPAGQSITLPEFQPSMNYYISYFPTRMDMTVVPDDGHEDPNTNGTVTLHLDQPVEAALNGIADFLDPSSNTMQPYLDTLHSDYAFIIAPMLVKSMHLPAAETDTSHRAYGWDFSVYPNPASHDLFLHFSDDAPKRIQVLEPSGREVRSWNQVSGFSHQLMLGDLAHGVYWIQVSTTRGSQTKKLIIQ